MKNPGKTKNNLSIEQRASHSALMAAIYRFLASKEEGSYFQGPDSLSELYLPPKAKFFLSFSFFRNLIRKKLNKRVPGSYEYITARTKHFDHLFKNALQGNIPQIVFLGAGYDTRVIRFEEYIQNTKIFELDASTTQQQKIKLLQKNNNKIHPNTSFVPINFGKQKLESELLKTAYDPSKRSLFIWEGVTMYLTKKAVIETLTFIKRFSGNGTSIAFDYYDNSLIEGKNRSYGAKELIAAAAKKGEPFLFGIPEGEIKLFLSENGFNVLSHYSPDEFEKHYLYDDNREQFLGKMYGFIYNVHAGVTP